MAMFLADEKWQLKLPRIKRFIEDTKEIYAKIEIKNNNLKKLLDNFLDRKDFADNLVAAEESLLLAVRFQNLAKII